MNEMTIDKVNAGPRGRSFHDLNRLCKYKITSAGMNGQSRVISHDRVRRRAKILQASLRHPSEKDVLYEFLMRIHDRIPSSLNDRAPPLPPR